MLRAKSISRDAANDGDDRFYGLKIFGMFLGALALGAGIGLVLLSI